MGSHLWRRRRVCNVLGGSTYLLGRHNGYGILWWNRDVVRAGILFALYTPAELENTVSMYARLDSANAPSAGADAGAGGAGAGTCGGGKSKKDRATHLHLGVRTRRRGCAEDAEALCREEQSGGVRNFGAPTGYECMTVDRGCGVCGGEWAAGEGTVRVVQSKAVTTSKRQRVKGKRLGQVHGDCRQVQVRTYRQEDARVAKSLGNEWVLSRRRDPSPAPPETWQAALWASRVAFF